MSNEEYIKAINTITNRISNNKLLRQIYLFIVAVCGEGD